MQLKAISLLILLVLAIPPVESQNLTPVLDGDIDEVWASADTYKVAMQNQITVDFRILTDSTTIYFLAILPHNGVNDVINLDTSKPHDYFGLEFDRNGDKVIHGTEDSPDDMVLINYFQPGAQDFLTKSFQVINDTAVGGREDKRGAVSTDGENIIFEFSVELSSGDILGSDISLDRSDSISVMLAFWDDRPTRDANVIVNKAVAGSVFLEFKLSINPLEDLIATTLVLIAFSVSIILVRRKFFTSKVPDKQIS